MTKRIEKHTEEIDLEQLPIGSTLKYKSVALFLSPLRTERKCFHFEHWTGEIKNMGMNPGVWVNPGPDS